MLLVLPVPFLQSNEKLLVESQAHNGLERWADNFESITIAAPVIPDDLAEQLKNMSWSDTQSLKEPKRFEFVPLPWAYSIPKFARNYRSVRASLGELISKHRYLQFAIGGLWGDWAAVAALEAQKQGRSYAIHTDRVEHQVIGKQIETAPLPKKIKAKIIVPLMERYHRFIIENSSLGLWHGQDCYSAYSSWCRNSYLIHNIHLKPQDQISSVELAEKIKQVKQDPVLRICYAGRLEPMKAPLDWLKAVRKAKESGVNLHATWMGDGSLRNEMKAAIQKWGLQSCVELTGFESSREKVLQKIRASHLMLFTHVTPESPRCLIEALICGTPIIGYKSDYASELVKRDRGGLFAPIKDWQTLSDLLVDLSKNRQQLSNLIQKASQAGHRFNDTAVFSERSHLIKQHLPVYQSNDEDSKFNAASRSSFV